ncbi:hypothetical protein KZO01_17430 [Kurthia zopfii]|uniref:DUF8042 domain-containing protein n=1 Tax=Kurthia zopfii TaxID=1650 RepID=A0A8B4Q8G4_9BACL|nr:hypothetical protein [Kurthia zopfii]PWI22648.1 hypothetical protein DF281_06225 [Kurthia zopfii]TDR39250.1 hypothetical protein DFR61_11225 [Kurthia zopfii]GEK31434.1 hypothetical protein KZO01_17430 [Kurthia zopfii]STX08795.1 Uncharacterised protein [Kurthia zopfii]
MIQIEEVVSDYNDYIHRIPAGCSQIVRFINENRISEALEMVVDFSEGITWLTSARSYLEAEGITLDWKENQVTDFLNEINSGLEVGDFVIVSDIFEYEIIPFFKGIKNIASN